MKAISTTTLAVICFLCQSFGQVGFGVKAGLNMSTIKADVWKADDPRFGLNLGVMTGLKLRKNIFIQPELLYSMKGYKFSANPGEKNSGALRLNYVSVPVLGGFRLRERCVILFGPEFSFLAKANSRYDNVNHSVSRSYRRFDVGFDLGISFMIEKNIGIDFRCSQGLNMLQGPAKTSPIIDYIPIRRASNRFLQMGLSYEFTSK